MIIGLHALITRLFPTTHSKEMDEQLLAEQLKRTMARKAALLSTKPTAVGQAAEVAVEEEPVVKKKLSLKEVVVFLVKSPHIRCLAPSLNVQALRGGAFVCSYFKEDADLGCIVLAAFYIAQNGLQKSYTGGGG